MQSLLFITALFCLFQAPSFSFKIRRLPTIERSSKGWAINENINSNTDINDKPIIVEIATRREITAAASTAKSSGSKRRKTKTGVYKEHQESTMEKVLDSPFSAVLGIIFNPTTLVLAVYLSSIGWSKVLWLQKFLAVFGKGSLKNGNKEVTEATETLSFQTFECEECWMELRPAKGRAKAIFGRPTFRCQKCGAKASSYFDVDDMSDPRAVERLERLEKEKLEEDDNRAEVEDDE